MHEELPVLLRASEPQFLF